MPKDSLRVMWLPDAYYIITKIGLNNDYYNNSIKLKLNNLKMTYS